MSKPYQLVIDTNVLIAGLRSKRGASYTLLRMLKDERWEINVSTALVFEYEETLKRESANLNLTFEDIDNLLGGICAIANKRRIFYLWRPISNDPDDDFLIDLAVECSANFIVTYNKRDLSRVAEFGILIATPYEFLQRVGELI